MQTNVLEYLENSARKFPQKAAFSDSKKEISYSELVDQSRIIGSRISEITKHHTNQPIGVVIDKNIESLIAFMGIIYSGNFYVPLDHKLPIKRLESIITVTKPTLIISTTQTQKFLNSIAYQGKVIEFDQLLDHKVNQAQLDEIRNKAVDTDPLYAIFTSGSTGKPKGVLISHRSVIDFIDHFTAIFNFSKESVFGNQAPFDFDVSVKDIYTTLKTGATLRIIPRSMFSFPIKLIEYLDNKGINTVIWATSVLRILANFKVFDAAKPKWLEKILFSGEVMPNKILNYWRENVPDAMYVNLYGPTEITCNCTYFIVDRPFANNDPLPIGIPFPNSDVFVLNDENKPIEKGQIGEICVRGSSLALGYYNNPLETSKAFVQNPLNDQYPEIIYRTGDRGSYNAQGELLFQSRSDNQIKHKGHRIELGEIELAANALEFLDVSCCLYDNKEEDIVIFYQSRQECDKEIVLGLMKYLPKYMLPNKFYHFEKIPLNKNGKIDRSTLRKDYIDESS